jgi:hypothetical protein
MDNQGKLQEGDACDGCGRPWLYREGDGGKDGPLSCYHRMDCPLVNAPPAGATQETLKASNASGSSNNLKAWEK